MKPNILMKIAVVFMAAFGAYAFSGNTGSQNSLYIHEDGQCRNVNVSCDTNGTIACKIITLDNTPYNVWSDLGCEIKAMHNSSEPIEVNF